MSEHNFKPCPCGSRLSSSWEYDARGIPLCRTCNECHEAKMKTYRPQILSNPEYDACEQIEPDDEW